MSSFSFQCPECEATLRSNNGAAPGKKVKCPTCQAIFAMPERPRVAEAPAAIREKPASPAPRRRLDEEDGDEERQRSKRNDEDREDDEVPRRKAKTRVREEDDDENEAPRRKAKGRVRDEDEVVDEVVDEEEPPRKSPRRREYEDEVIDEEYREEDVDYEERPRRKKRKKKRKARSSNRLAVLIIVGSLLFLLLTGGGTAAYFIWFHGVNWGSGNEEPWAFVHPDANVVFGVDFGAIANDPALGPQIEQALKSRPGGSTNFEQIKKDTGLEYKELFAQTVVALTVDPAHGGNPFAGMGGGPRGAGAGPPMTMVLKASRSFSQKKLAGSFKNAKQKKLNGKVYYEVDEQPFKYAFMPSNRTLVMTSAPESQLTAILGASNDKPTIADSAAMIRTVDKRTAWAIIPFTGKMREVMQEAIKQQPGAMKPMADAMSQAKGFGFWANLDANTLTIGFNLFCGDANTATQVANQAATALQQQKGDMGQLDMFLGMLPKTKQAIKELVESFQDSAQDTVMVGTGQVSRQTINDVVREFKGLGANFQGGAAPGGGAPGGGMAPGGPPPGGGKASGGGGRPGGGRKKGG